MIVTPVHRWSCPNCPLEDITHEARPHTRYHICAGLMGLTAPMVPAGTKVKVTAHEREDYLNEEMVGPIMSITTEREDGSNDTMVFAPTAVAKAKEL